MFRSKSRYGSERETKREEDSSVCICGGLNKTTEGQAYRQRGQTDRETQRSDDSLFTAQWQIVSVSACRPRVIPSDHGSDRGIQCSRSDRISKLTG